MLKPKVATYPKDQDLFEIQRLESLHIGVDQNASRWDVPERSMLKPLVATYSKNQDVFEVQRLESLHIAVDLNGWRISDWGLLKRKIAICVEDEDVFEVQRLEGRYVGADLMGRRQDVPDRHALEPKPEIAADHEDGVYISRFPWLKA